MTRNLRYLPRPGAMVEITQRTIQGRFLFRPSPRLNRIVVGCLAKAQTTTAALTHKTTQRPDAVKLHAVAVLSNHFHLLASFETVEHMARFMNHLKTNLSKEIGRLHDWPGPLFAGRYTSIPVSDEPEAQIARLRYLLSQGVKEGLVLSPRDWPGVHCAEALADGKPLRGLWVDRARLFAARQIDKNAKELDFTTEEALSLEAIPAWERLSAIEQQSAAASMIDAIESEAEARYQATQTVPLGATAVCKRLPHERPASLNRSPRPRFHAATRSMHRLLLEAYRLFEAAYRDAADRLTSGDLTARFPGNCYPPRMPFVAPSAA